MTESRLVSREDFYNAINSITYRNQDIAEAQQFGCSTIEDCYNKAKHRFASYYVIYEDTVPIVTVMLQRDGYIIFFISNNVQNSLALIRVLKELADMVVMCAGPIITKTAYWYEEAQRLNKIIGFKEYQLYDYFGYYVKEE
jgi:hypothetical protein